MKIGSSDISAAYIGSTAINKVYIGSTEVWSSFTGLLDIYTGAAAAYSLRLLRAAYTGSAIRVRRASDNTEQNIGFVDNELDTTTLASFCSGTNGFVTTWYDQSGNGYNATEATAANQPQIVSSGSVLDDVTLLDAGDKLVLNSTINSSELSVFAVLNPASGGMLVNNGLTSYLWYRDGFSVRWRTSVGNININASPTFGSVSIDSWIYDGTTGTVYQNGNSISSGAVSGNIGTKGIGDISTIDNLVNGYREIVIYPSDQSSNRAGIETNMNNFYTIY